MYSKEGYRMNPYKVFIVGHEGTTGLRIHERLSGRNDITLLSISDEDRKNIDVIASIACRYCVFMFT